MHISKAIEVVFLAFLALACLPLSTSALLLNYLYISLSRPSVRRALMRTPGFKSRTVLITGVNTKYGLRLARAFHRTGHLVVGAYHEPGSLPIHVRFSNAVSKFYRLAFETEERYEARYIASLVHIIEHEHVDLWVDCSSGANLDVETHALDAIQRNTKCQSFASRISALPYLADRDTFLKYLGGQGMPVPESYQVTSRAEIHDVLSKSKGNKKYLLQSVEPNGINANTARTMLPSRTTSQTYDAVSRLAIANTTPWKLERDIDGLERISTFAIIIRGSVKAFVASRSLRPGCYQALEPDSALCRSMLRFVQMFAHKEGPGFTTHLGVDFCVDEQAAESGVNQAILPVEVSVHTHPSIQLFAGMDGSITLSRAYLSLLVPDRIIADKKTMRPAPAIIQQQTQPDDVALPNTDGPGIYCFGQDLLYLCFEPLRDLIAFRISLGDFLHQVFQLSCYLLLWKDDTYDFQDPLPFWWLYQVYTPVKMIRASLIMGGKQRYIRAPRKAR